MFTEKLPAVDELFSGYFSENHAPGMVYGVANRGELIHWRALGEAVVGKQPMERSTAFRIASLTKSFTAMAVLKLRDRGLINLDSPFVTYVPDLYSQQSEIFEITVRQLLTMSAGFPTDNKWADRIESITDTEFLELISAGFRFDSRPGTRFEYSNLGYAILARIIANVSKMSFIQFVTQEIFSSLGLRNTTFDYREAHNLAMGYANIDGWKEEAHQSPGAFSSIGGAITTLDDLVVWSHYLSSAFDPDEPELGPLKKSSRREMQNIHQDIPVMRGFSQAHEYKGIRGYGFGLRIEENFQLGKFAGHTGGYPGFGTHMIWHAPSGISIIALANGRYADPVQVSTPALKTIIESLPPKKISITRELEFIRAKTFELVTRWDDAKADTFFAVNMDLDYPRDLRRNKIEEVLSECGAISEEHHLIESYNNSHLKWVQRGSKRNLQLEILLAPLAPLQLQVLKVSAVNLFDTGFNEG